MLSSRIKSGFLFLRCAILPVLTFSLVVGVLVGIVVNLYNHVASLLANIAERIYAIVAANLWYLPLLLIGLVTVALIVSALIKITPECKGSGIPRTEGVLRGILTFRWLRIFLTTMINTMLAFLAGMSLGTEGPSIQIGAALADGIVSRPYLRGAWRRHVLTGGASAGLAVAFNAPLTGIVFALEEVHRKFSPILLFITALTVIIATTVSNLISVALGLPLIAFEVGAMAELPISSIWAMLILGLAIGLIACVFNILITRSDKLISKIKHCPQTLKLIVAFIITGLFAVFIPSSIGGGHDLVINTAASNYSPGTLALLFLIKLFLVALCFNSGATGGLFVPMLTLGALIGGIVGWLCIAMGLDPIYYTSIVVIGMASFVGASTRAPITAMVLVIEITGQFKGFLMTGFAIIIACLIPHVFRVKPLYEALLHKITTVEAEHEPPSFSDANYKGSSTTNADYHI